MTQGEQHTAPPTARSLRTMAIVRWILLGSVTTLAGYTVWTYWGPQGGDETQQAHEEVRFYCPMHPQIRSPKPGECPICHMNLEPIPEERRNQRATEGSPGIPTPSAAPHPSDVTTVTLSEEKQRSVGLVTSVVERASLGERLRVPGIISAPETGLSQVRIRAPGFVEHVLVGQAGVHVRRGQPLALIYSPEMVRSQEEFLAALRWSQPGDKATVASKTNATMVSAARRSLELLGLTHADIDEIARTGQAMRAVPVRATSSGYITRFNAVLGSRADPEMTLYEITDLSQVWIVASVHEQDVISLRRGSPVRFRLSGNVTTTRSARIDLIEPLVEEATRTTRVRLVIPNREGTLRPGQFGEVEFDLPTTDGVFVPRDAVIRTGEHNYVYVATGADRFEPRSVRTGMVREGRVQILSGVAEGDRIVTRGSFMLDSESRLQASLAATPKPGR